jgi:hypothetical protein
MNNVRTSQETLPLPYEPNGLMRSICFWRRYIYIIITVLDIVHCPVFNFKHIVSETAFYLRLRVETTRLGSIDRALSSSPDRVQLGRFRVKTDTFPSLRNVAVKSKTGLLIMPRIVIVTLIYHRHKPTDRIYLLYPYWRRNVSPVRYEHYPSCVVNRRQDNGWCGEVW